MSNWVSFEEVLSLVVNMLPIDISQETDKIYQWILQSELRIGSQGVALPHKECIVDITNFRGELPKDFYKVQAVKLNNFTLARYTGNSFVYFDQNSPYLANGGWNGMVLNSPYCYGDAKYSINGRFIDITPNLPKVGLSYTALPIDSRGLPMCNELHTQAVATYIRYQLISSRYFSEKLSSRAIYMDAKAEWEVERTRAQYIDAEITPDEADYIGNIVSHHYHSANLNNEYGYSDNYYNWYL